MKVKGGEALTDCLHEILSNYSTPAFVFDENEVIRRSEMIRDILGEISLCYSIKANPFLIPALLPEVDYLEVCSPGELSICTALKVPPDKIIYSGLQKGTEDINEALRYGAAIITAESEMQYELIHESAVRSEVRTDVILRLSSGNQFGMSADSVERILADRDDRVNIAGLHYFAGTGRHKLSKQREELKMLSEFMGNLREKYGIELPMLEYGPGLPFPYFTDEDFSDTLLPLKEIADDLTEAGKKCRLSVEMGRFLASSCGYYLTSVRDVKKTGDTNWCIVDGGINHVNYYGQMMGMKIPLITHYRNGECAGDSEDEKWTVCGSLCTINDILVRALPLNDPKPGDILVFKNIGAYSVTEAIGLFLSRTLPQIIACRDGRVRMLRDYRESWEINIPMD